MAEPTPAPTLTLDEAMALLEKHEAEAEAEAEAKKKNKKEEKVEEVKDLIKAGAQQGRGGLNAGASRQLGVLEEEGY